MSDEDEYAQDYGASPSAEDEWILPGPCQIQSCLHWSDDGIFAVATRETVYLIDPCQFGNEGLIGSVSLLKREEQSPLPGYRVYEYSNDTRILDDLQTRNTPTVSAVAWSPEGLSNQVSTKFFLVCL